MKPQKTIEELKKEFANKIAKIKLKEKKEKEKIKLNTMNDLIMNLEKNEYFRNELFNLLNSPVFCNFLKHLISSMDSH